MGRTYIFSCEKCGYRAKVEGGSGEGFDIGVQTILCHECRELVDAVTRWRVPVALSADETVSSPPPFSELVNKLPLTAETEWKHFDLACSVSPDHLVRVWNQPDKCPHCGIFMDRSPMPFRQWD